MKRRLPIIVLVLAAIAVVVYLTIAGGGNAIVLTGIVTTDEIIVSSQVQGRLQELKVDQGDSVKRGDLLGLIQAQQWLADMAFYSDSEQQTAALVTQAEEDLKFQEAQTSNQVAQALANLAAAEAQVVQANADLENSRLTFQRLGDLYREGVESAQANDQSRTAFDAAKAHVTALSRQVEAAQAAVALAKAYSGQVAARRAILLGTQHQLAAAGAQKEKAKVQLDYTEIRAPMDGIVNMRVALPGEVVSSGQAIISLIDPDHLWIRADVEESFIDGIRLGDRLRVRLPSGAQREGTVFYRGVDADYATQRDVSRTKRDIKTFEIRLRCDNRDRSLAVGMTAYVTLTLPKR